MHKSLYMKTILRVVGLWILVAVTAGATTVYTYTGSPLTQIVGTGVQDSTQYIGQNVSLSFSLPFNLVLPANLVGVDIGTIAPNWINSIFNSGGTLPDGWWKEPYVSWHATDGIDVLSEGDPHRMLRTVVWTDSVGSLLGWSLFAAQTFGPSDGYFGTLITICSGGGYATSTWDACSAGDSITPNYNGDPFIGASNSVRGTWSVTSDVIPEPSSVLLISGGLIFLATVRRRLGP
jgi:hypothetical protein